MTRALALAMLALGCQGTSGGILPDARELDAASEPCSDPGDWSTRSPRLIAPFGALPAALAVDAAYVYWTEPLTCADASCFPGPIVLRAPLQGGEPEILFESEEQQPGSLFVTRDYLFVSIGDQLWRSHKDGSSPEAIGGLVTAVDADAVYYWQEGGTLIRRDADTLAETPVGEAMEIGPDLQLVGDAAWWLDPDPVDIWRMPLATGTAEIAVQLTDNTGASLAVSATGDAFLATGIRGDPQVPPTLVRIPVGASEPQPIADLWDGILDIVVDDTHVYWMEANVHRLSRMPLEGGCVESRDLEVAFVGMATTAEGPVVATAGSIALVER